MTNTNISSVINTETFKILLLYNTIKYPLNYYFFVHCKLFIILIGSDEANKKNSQAKDGLKEKTLKLKFFSTTVKMLDSRDCDARLLRSGGILCIFKACERKSLGGLCDAV